jgi:hypothetical protein
MRWITQEYPQSFRDGFVGRAFSEAFEKALSSPKSKGGPSENKTFHVEALQELMGFNWTHLRCKALDFFSWRSLKLRKSISWVAFRPINLIGTPPVTLVRIQAWALHPLPSWMESIRAPQEKK